MTSQINPNNIDVAFPIPGQDNPSQGFRNNFLNIRNSFNVTKNEITDLQNTKQTILNDSNFKRVGNISLLGAGNIDAPLLDSVNNWTKLNYFNFLTVTPVSGVATLDFSAGCNFVVTANSSTTNITVSNVLPGKFTYFTLTLIYNGATQSRTFSSAFRFPNDATPVTASVSATESFSGFIKPNGKLFIKLEDTE